jgi:pimeloyl-ACP methyl ester carboxylesterase
MPTLELDSTTLWYDVTGSGPPLVFVHGGWSHARAWQPQIDYFADGYRVITLDVRGHGRTGGGDGGRYSINLFADDLEEVFDHVDVDRPLLVGLSLGAMVVQAYLARHPDRATGAVLAGPARSMPPVDLPRRLKPFVSPLPALASMLSVGGSEATFRWLLASSRATTGGPWLAVDPAVRARAIDTGGDVPPAEFRKIFAALYRFDPPDLGHVSTPVRVIYGDHESPLVKHQAGQILSALPRGSLTEIPDAGHLVNLDQPHVFNATCAEFLTALEPAA